MMIQMAMIDDLKLVKDITSETIKTIYPHYYPIGAVDFFLKHHDDYSIKHDIENGKVLICKVDDKSVGTVSVLNNEIKRLFVLPAYQKKGYGGMLLSYAEQCVADNYDYAQIDVSLAAKSIYLKRKYYFKEYHVISTDNGDFLCYDIMEKVLIDVKLPEI